MNAPNRISRIKLAVLAAAVLGLAAAMPATAAPPNATVTVNATVLGVCKFEAPRTATMTISNGGAGGTIDPSLPGDATGNATLSYKCSNGTTPAFALSPTSPTTVSCSAGVCSGSTMPVTIALTSGGAGAGMGSGKEKKLALDGTFLQADYVNAQEGAYTRTVTVSVTP